MKKFITLALALCLALSASVFASAAEVNSDGGSGSTPVNLTTTNGGLGGEDDGQVTPTKLNVTVPTALPLVMSDDGTGNLRHRFIERFYHRTNINIANRIVSFNIKKMENSSRRSVC